MLNSKIIKLFIIITFCVSVCNCVSCMNTNPDLSQSTDALKAEICKKPKDGIKFPLKIKHEYGTTVIRKKPQRIATYGFYNHEEDTILALNIAPIAISDVRRQEEIPKWQIEKLHELNAPIPAIVNMKMKWYPEAIQSHKPDVIFVDSSELESYDNYKKLSKIAPVIPFTDYVVQGSEIKGNQRIMECKVRLYARVLGVSKRGELLIRKIRSTIKNALNTYPSLKRKHVILANVYMSSIKSISIGHSNLDDPRTRFLYDVGLPLPKALKYLNSSSPIFGAELPTYFSDIDVFVPYNPSDLNADKIASLQADQYAGQIPAIKNGRIIQFDQNNKDYGLISYSYPLSILWGLNTYLDMIEKTSQK